MRHFGKQRHISLDQSVSLLSELFQKRIIAFDIRTQEGLYIPASSIIKSVIFDKIRLVLNSVQFATIPKHVS